VAKDEKLKVFLELFKVHQELDEFLYVTDEIFFRLGLTTDAEKEEFKNFLSDAVNSNLTKIFKEELSEKELDDLISVFSSPDLLNALEHHTLLFDQAILRINMAVGDFLNQKALGRLAEEADKEEKN